MFSDIANEFQNITKFKLLDYFIDYQSFLDDDYNDVYDYYAGNSEEIDVSKINNLSNLLSKSYDLIRTFQDFSGKLGNVGYWELQQYCQDLKDTLERISKLPKYLRTAKSNRGYKPYIQVNCDIGGMKTIQDVSEQLDNITEQELILNNDLEESDYEIDELSSITAFVDNSTNIVVDTILEQPIGNKIYGKDICRKISFNDNDLSLVKYEDNIVQKVDILAELNKGDVPEYPNFGKNIVTGNNYNTYNYAELVSDIRETFLQDSVFSSVNVANIEIKNGDVYITCEIKTKYVYSVTKDMKL
jgi:HPt (histidine-containing phosphotransfer) domain-containing protein